MCMQDLQQAGPDLHGATDDSVLGHRWWGLPNCRSATSENPSNYTRAHLPWKEMKLQLRSAKARQHQRILQRWWRPSVRYPRRRPFATGGRDCILWDEESNQALGLGMRELIQGQMGPSSEASSMRGWPRGLGCSGLLWCTSLAAPR